MTVTVPVSELKQRTGEVLSKAVVDRQDVVIERYGREYAVILSLDRYQMLVDTASDQVFARFREAREDVYRVTKDIPPEEIEALVSEALEESRRERASPSARSA